MTTQAVTAQAFTQLQFGHSQKAVENLTDNPVAAGYLMASIRPQPKGRGERTGRPGPCAGGAASIRPQPKGRGERTPGFAIYETHPTLQFGHSQKAVENPQNFVLANPRQSCFNSATAKRPWRTKGTRSKPSVRLRWASIRPQPKGRGERPTPGQPHGGDEGFNSATAKRPWRTRLGWTQVESILSFNSATAKRPWRTRRRSGAGRAAACFNSATAKRPWRTAGVSAAVGAAGSGFNSATAKRPWRTGIDAHGHHWLNGLQFGHSQKAVENVGQSGSGWRCARCFNSATAKRPWRTSHGSPLPSWASLLQFGHSQKAVENPCGRLHDAARRLRTASIRPQPKGRGERTSGPPGRSS